MSANADSSIRTLLVVPCYCESKRLPGFLPTLCQEISDSKLDVNILVVDDGSPSEEPSILKRLVEDLRNDFSMLNAPLLLEVNQGKGGAIRAGWDLAAGFDQLAFVDADGAIPASEVVRVLKTANLGIVHLAVRDPKDEHQLQRTLPRKIVASVFNWMIRTRYDIHVSDTQCGFKIVPASFYRSVRERLVQCGYAFDLELILAASKSGYPIETTPVDWKEMPGGTTNLKDGLTFLKQLIKHSI